MIRTGVALVCLFILGFIILFPIWQPGLYASHDGEIHVARLAQFTQAILDGQMPVRWLAAWFDGMGYPVFIYAYSFPYYVGALIRLLLQTSFVDTLKLLLVGSFLISGMLQFFFLRRFFGLTAAFAGAAFFLFAPYRFADLYERAALGESFALLFVPALFFATHRIFGEKKDGILWFGLVVSGFIMTHLITFALVLPFWFGYTLVAYRHAFFQKFPHVFFGFVLGLLLSTFSWIPLVFERGYTNADVAYQTIYRGHFVQFLMLLRSESAIQLGVGGFSIFVLSAAMIVRRIVKKQSSNTLALFFLATTLIAFFLILPIAAGIWDGLSPLQFVVFPWRFLIWIVFAISFLAAWLVEELLHLGFRRGIVVFVFLSLAVFPSRHFMQPTRFEQKNDTFYLTFPDPTRLEMYFLPKGISRDYRPAISERLVIAKGVGEIKLVEDKSGKLTAVVNASTHVTVLARTIFFPGWDGFIDTHPIPIRNEHGLIVFDVPKGLHILELEFQETPVRRVGDFISLLSLFFVVGWIVRMLPRIKMGKKTIPQ